MLLLRVIHLGEKQKLDLFSFERKSLFRSAKVIKAASGWDGGRPFSPPLRLSIFFFEFQAWFISATIRVVAWSYLYRRLARDRFRIDDESPLTSREFGKSTPCSRVSSREVYVWEADHVSSLGLTNSRKMSRGKKMSTETQGRIRGVGRGTTTD